MLRFALAFAAPWAAERCGGAKAHVRWRDERLFAAMGLAGIVAYQFLENCAIYYTNASNVAILVSFAAAFLGERVTGMQIAGGCMILAGVAAATNVRGGAR